MSPWWRGYAIWIEDCIGSKTMIKYMTDVMLLLEIFLNEYIVFYSHVIMVNEVHEWIIHARNIDKICGYFFNCPIFTIFKQTFLDSLDKATWDWLSWCCHHYNVASPSHWALGWPFFLIKKGGDWKSLSDFVRNN